MMKAKELSAMLYPESLVRSKEVVMFDFNTYLSGEVRHLTFQKSLNHGLWQDSMRQQEVNTIEKRLGKYIKSGWLSDLPNTILFHLGLWKQHILSPREERLQANQPLTALGSKTSENHQSG
jgi:hypothetical protein